MRASKVLVLSLVLGSAMPAAHAADSGTVLDTKLPEEPLFASPYRNDPPGTWYGDKSLPTDENATVQHSACPATVDGSARPVTGAVTTGFGWSSHGSSRYNAATVNYCKEHVDEDGDSKVFNLQLNVSQFDGPGAAVGRGNPMRPGGPRPARRR
jgi:hypothetical protein